MRPKKLDVSYSENQENISPIGNRYTTKMSKIFGEDSYIQALLDVEAQNTLVLSEMYPNKVPKAAAKKIKSIANTKFVKPSEIRKLEAEKTHHEMAAVINTMSEKAGDEGKYVHFAMTSADAVETAKAMQISKAFDILIDSASQTRDVCFEAALNWKAMPAITRTHGQQAVVASFGLSFAFFGYSLQKSIERLKYDRDNYVEGKLSGAIGTYDVHTIEGIDGEKVEEKALRNLKVKKADMTMQIPARENIAYIISDLSILCGRLEAIAEYVKTLKRTEILELREVPEESSTGSSAMPHKNVNGNPFIEERCISIARIVRGHALSALESVSSEDFRDLTASLSDRITISESFILCDYSCNLIANVIERSEAVEENIVRNLAYTKGVTSSPLVMSRLIEKGMQRNTAREASLRNANAALKESGYYVQMLLNDKEITKLLTKEEIIELCKPESNMGKSKEIIERITKKYMKK